MNSESAIRERRLTVGERALVTIESIAHGGHFVTRVRGQVVFVRYTIPGEEVEIEITEVLSKIARAKVVSVISASPFRVSALCPFFEQCGGCDFQHIEYQHQLLLKSRVISEQLLRLAKVECEVPVRPTSLGPFGWRTRMDFALTRHGQLGLYGSRSDEVVAIDDCLIADPRINLSGLAKQRWKGSARVECAVSSEGDFSIVRDRQVVSGPRALHEKVGDHHFTISPQSFWQSHRKAPEILTNEVLDRLQIRPGQVVADLYAGVGLFSAAISRRLEDSGLLHLVESDMNAIRNAQAMFGRNAIVSIHRGTVAQILPTLGALDAVVMDPPRTGAGREVVDLLLSTSPSRIVYVSCDPASFARDTAWLIEGGYSMNNPIGHDLFPMTHHVELVATFTRG